MAALTSPAVYLLVALIAPKELLVLLLGQHVLEQLEGLRLGRADQSDAVLVLWEVGKGRGHQAPPPPPPLLLSCQDLTRTSMRVTKRCAAWRLEWLTTGTPWRQRVWYLSAIAM